jgi:tetratricopeptide (TPR) repeat protein
MNEPMSDAPGSFERVYAEARRLFEDGQFDAAIEAFSRAAALDPRDFRPWEMTACCLGGLARWEECLAAFERARELGHECHLCWYNRALALTRLRRADDALQALDRSLALEPDNAAAWYKRGLILGMAEGRADGELEPFDGRHEQAVAEFDRVLKLEPDHYGAWYCKACTLYKISHSGAAMQRLFAAGASPDILQQALACVDRALELGPDREEAAALRDDILDWIAECERSRPT